MTEKIKVIMIERIDQLGVNLATMLPNYVLQVDSRAYYENGSPIMGTNGVGEEYHLGQLSSSLSWARHDMIEHFKNEYDKLFPGGWEVEFKIDSTP